MFRIDIKVIVTMAVIAVILGTNLYVSYLKDGKVQLEQALQKTEKDYKAVKQTLELVTDYYEIDQEVKREVFNKISAIDVKRRPAVGELFLK